MKNFLKISCQAALILSSLNAESSGFFLNGAYEVGQAYYNNELTINKKTEFKSHNEQSFQGFGVGLGYNQLFGQKGWAGLRYYGFYDWAGVKFGTQYFAPGSYLQAKGGLNSNMNINTYGVGIDLLLNFVNSERFSMGFYGGVGVGGTTWSTQAKNRTITWSTTLNEQQAERLLNGDYDVSIALKSTVFQWSFNFGVRSVIAKHTGLELGFRIPMVATPYLTMVNGDSSYKETFKRLYSFNVSYYLIF